MKFPQTIRHRDAKVKIYRPSPSHPFYKITWRALGKRHQKSFKTYRLAKDAAEAKAREIAKGSIAASLTSREAKAFCLAVERLHPLGINLSDAVAEFVEAKKILGDSESSLPDAARFFLKQSASVKRISIAEAVEQYLAERVIKTRRRPGEDRPQLSERMHYQDSIRLKKFAAACRMDVCDLSREVLELFTSSLNKLAPKTINHHKASVRSFLLWCVEKEFLPADQRLSGSPALRNEKAVGGNIEIYTPEEFASLLAHTEGELHLLTAIGGLAGLRTEERLRLDYSDLWRRPGFIEVTSAKAKTRQRRLIPICESLEEWMNPFRSRKKGSIWVQTPQTYHDYFRGVLKTAGIKPRQNGLRHSYISCLLTDLGDEHKTAQISGTSPAMIYKNYRELVTPDEAKAWFDVKPSAPANVVPLTTSKTG